MYRFINIFEKKTHFSTRSKIRPWIWVLLVSKYVLWPWYYEERKKGLLAEIIDRTFINIKINV